MVKGVSSPEGNNTLNILLKQRQSKMNSIKQQKDAVEQQLATYNKEASGAKIQINGKEISLSDAITALSNHPFKGMKVPVEPNEPQRELIEGSENDSDSQFEMEMEQFNVAMATYNKEKAEFDKAEKEYNALELKVKTETEVLTKDKTAFDKLMQTCQAKEDELKTQNAEYDVTMGDIEDINAQMKDAKYEVTIEKGDNSLTKAMSDDLKALKDAGLVSGDIDPSKYTKKEWAALCAQLVTADNANEGKNNDLTGMGKDYKHMQIGDKKTYSLEQLQEIAKAGGYELDSTSTGFSISGDDIEALIKEDEAKKAETSNEVVKESKSEETPKENPIKLPRGINWQGENKGTSLADFGIKDNGDGTYTSSKGKIFNANQVNDYFRSIENNVDSKYSKILDKAEKAGVDINEVLKDVKSNSGKDAIEALKSAIKLAKTEEKPEVKPEVKPTKAEVKAKCEQREAYQKVVSQIKEKQQEIDNLVEKYGLDKYGQLNVKVNFDNPDNDDKFKYIYLKQDLIILENTVAAYENVVEHWKNGATGTFNGVPFTKDSLEDGTEVYKIGNTYYPLDSKGFPDMKKPIAK